MRYGWLCMALALVTTTACGSGPGTADERPARLALESGWRLQSSASVQADPAALSQPGFDASEWHAITVPSTVVGALVDNGTYPDPYFGDNLRSLPGMEYALGKRFSLVETPEESPFKPSWWYRTEFDLPASQGQSLALHFDGINYRANIWVNGRQIANATDVAGAFRRYEMDVTTVLRPGERNVVAAEVFGPEPDDLAIMWVDWNPTPPDKNMGLWGPVYVTQSGAVALRHPHVIAALDVPSLRRADLTVTTDVWNTTDRQVQAAVTGVIESIRFSREVTLGPREHRQVRFTPADVSDLRIENPRVWWPYRYGAQELYTLTLDATVDDEPSDHLETTFGIERITSEIEDGHRLFRVNGKPILIRGGGWASDMLLRPKTTERLAAEFRYVKEMGLNTIRMEGKLETDEFYDLADREGILLMPGWTCCDQWEMWDKWDAEDYRVAPASLRDQILRIRNHPSVAMWLNGSDYAPPPAVERTYLDVLRDLEFQKPAISSASERTGESTKSGMKMRGPYAYVPPKYWLTDTKYGGAFGFASEVGPGAAPPPIESLKRMLTADHLWPIDEVWQLHAGGDQFKDIHRFTRALEARYGPATSAVDYARKAQAMAYDGERAMFEAYSRNKYTSTGVIQWMLNNAWPSTIWHLYDYYLRPGGGYFGTKKALEPLHVQYSYDDRSVVIVNDLQQPFADVTVSAEVLGFDLASRFSRQATVDVEPDAVVRALEVPALPGLSGTYFVRLTATNPDGAEVSRNFYWLSTRDDVLDWEKSTWYDTPVSRHADLRALATLPATTLRVTSRFEQAGGEGRAVVRVTNTGKALAFQVRLKAMDPARGEEMLPVFWDDNYFALLPGETREIGVAYPLTTSQPRIDVEAWNVR